MWNQLSSLTNSIAQQATDLAQEVGLDETLAQAKNIASNVISMQPLDDGEEDEEYTDEEDYVDETALHTTTGTHRSPSRGYLKDSSENSRNGQETELLRQRLQNVEAAAADALGELEDYKEKLQAAIKSRDAARAQITKLKSAAAAESKNQSVDTSSSIISQREVEKLKLEVDALKKELEKAKETTTAAVEEKEEDVSAIAATQEELQALKQKMGKAKRQFTAMKQQLAEAMAAKEEALEKLQALAQEKQQLDEMEKNQDNAENEEEKEKEVAALKSENLELLERIRAIEEKLSPSEMQQHEVIKNKEDETAALTQQLNLLSSQKLAVEEQVAALIEEKAALLSTKEVGEAKESTSQVATEDKNVEENSITNKLELLKQANQELEQRCLQAENELNKFKEEQAEKTEDTLIAELDALKEENATLSARVEQAEAAAKAASAAAAVLAISDDKNEEEESSKEKTAAAEGLVMELRAELKQKSTELEALREGAKAESQLAAAAVKNAEQKAEDALHEIEEIKSALAAAQEAHQEAVTARTAAFASIETERIRASEAAAQAEQWQVECQKVQRRLEEEKVLAAEKVASTTEKIREEIESAVEEKVSTAVAAALQEAEEAATAAVDKMQGELEELQQRCQEAESALKIAESSRISDAQGAEKVESLLQTANELQSKADKAVADATASAAALEDALKECEGLREAANERQKRFAAVQSSFKARKDEFVVQAEHLTAAVAAAEARAIQAETVAAEAKQLAEIAVADKNHAVDKVESLINAKSATEALVLEAQNAAAAATERAAAAEAKLAAAEETAIATAAQIEQLQAKHAEALEKTVEEMKSAVAGLELQLLEARSALADAVARAESAESAKIELSLKVAELAQERGAASEDVDALPSGEAAVSINTSKGNSDDDRGLLERAEAAELAAAAAARRATAAESEIDSLKVAVAEAEKKAKEMAWQVKMLASSTSSSSFNGNANSNLVNGGADGQIIVPGEGRGRLQQLGGMLDMFGCAINYNRRGGQQQGR